MSSRMIAPSTSTSAVCEPRRHLAASVVAPPELAKEDLARMYSLLQRYFAGTTRAMFDEDLREKQHVILLRDEDSGRIQGFSTLMRMIRVVEGSQVVAFFSGDTIIDRRYWGETVLSRVWAQTVFAEADKLRQQLPAACFLWFLICSGYKTWRFLPLFFHRFYPNPAMAMPEHIRRMLDALAIAKFGDEYMPDAGIVRFKRATPLRAGVAEITDERARDPNVAFFVRMNPGHASGDELACLADLSPSNLTRAAHRLISRPVIA